MHFLFKGLGVASVFFLILMGVYIYYFYPSWIQESETKKTAAFNPYTSFNKIFECHCDLGGQIVHSPYLKILSKGGALPSAAVDELWQLSLTGNKEAGPNLLYLKYDKSKCGLIDFAIGDLISIRGTVSIKDGMFFITPDNGYIEYRGKKHCL